MTSQSLEFWTQLLQLPDYEVVFFQALVSRRLWVQSKHLCIPGLFPG